MKDFTGKELQVGNEIAYATSRCHSLSRGVVCQVGKASINVLGEGNTKQGRVSSTATRVVKIGKSYHKTFKLTEFPLPCIEKITDEVMHISDLNMSQVGRPTETVKFCDSPEEQALLKDILTKSHWYGEEDEVKTRFTDGILLEILKDIKTSDDNIAYQIDVMALPPDEDVFSATLPKWPHFALRIVHS